LPLDALLTIVAGREPHRSSAGGIRSMDLGAERRRDAIAAGPLKANPAKSAHK